MPIRIDIPGVVPPSLNRTGSRGGWRVWNRHKKELQEHVGMALMVKIRPPRELQLPVIVDATLWFPVNRRRDEGNYRSLLEKAVGDALVAGGWIEDDTPSCFRFKRVEFMKGDVQTTLLLREGWNDGAESRVKPAGSPSPALRGGTMSRPANEPRRSP